MQQYRQQFSSMGCPCEIRLYAPISARRAIEAAIAEIDRLDKKYSLYRDDSLLGQINGSAGQRIAVDDETASV